MDPTPGSPAAIKAGCTCDPKRNNGGLGHPRDGRIDFYPAENCPLHGLAPLLRELRIDDPGEIEAVVRSLKDRWSI